MTDDTLPTLPRPASLSDHSIVPFVGQYSADQMRTYAAEAVRAALAAQVPQWLPMDAVPKDGRRVLVAIEGVDRAVVAMWNGGAWETVDGNCWTGRAITHWMPLPAAPDASPPPAALAVPAGMALVPVEPTPEMLYPDLQTAGPGTQLGDMCAGFGREIWARMLAASQESATTRGGVSRNADLSGRTRSA